MYRQTVYWHLHHFEWGREKRRYLVWELPDAEVRILPCLHRLHSRHLVRFSMWTRDVQCKKYCSTLEQLLGYVVELLPQGKRQHCLILRIFHGEVWNYLEGVLTWLRSIRWKRCTYVILYNQSCCFKQCIDVKSKKPTFKIEEHLNDVTTSMFDGNMQRCLSRRTCDVIGSFQCLQVWVGAF